MSEIAITAVHRRLTELEEENRWLRRELGMMTNEHEVVRLVSALRIYPCAARVVSCLYGAKGRTVKWETLMAAVPPIDHADPMERESNNVRVWVLKARKALGNDAIATAYGMGYRLTEAGRERVAAILK